MKRYLPAFVLVLSLAGLTYGFHALLALRFESGDVYPAYSSLRSDPLGTMALYESLSRLEGFTATRDFSVTGMPNPAGVTYMRIATTAQAWDRIPPATMKRVDQFVRQGARLVITIFPEATRAAREVAEKQPKPAAREAQENTVSLWQQWGLRPRVVDLSLGQQEVFQSVPVMNVSRLSLPQTLDWHSGLVLERLNAAWKPIYARGTGFVLLERDFGSGSVVVATDSFFLSNEAMHSARHSDLVAWLIGPNRTVMFDEAHLGVVEQPGMSALLRRYRLKWLIAAVALLGALFVWKNAVSLVPVDSTVPNKMFIEGKDSSSGFVNLLRRNIPARDILATCYSEWKKSAAQSGSYSAARLQKAEAAYNAESLRTAKEKNPVETYKAITGILHK